MTKQRRSIWYWVGLWGMGLFYVVAGFAHFLRPEMYVRVMPSYIPWALAMVYISGVAEVLGGIGVLVPRTRIFAAWGLVLMLISFLPVHVNMCLHPSRFPEVPLWVIWLRLPLQLPLIVWAWWYARRSVS